MAIYNGATNGTKVVLVTALGNIVALMFLSTLSISGISTILLTSKYSLSTIKLLGALYLIYMGFRQFLSGTKALGGKSGTTEKRPLFSYFKEGFGVAATNPKPMLFFIALFSQFLDASKPIYSQFFIMTIMFMALSFISLSCYGFLAHRISRTMPQNNVAKWLHTISGILFVGMGTSILLIK